MAVYTGLYVQRDSNGEVLTVQAVDTAGGSYALRPETYIAHGGKPDIDQLPDIEQYQELKK